MDVNDMSVSAAILSVNSGVFVALYVCFFN
jgi:hypothetical protein